MLELSSVLSTVVPLLIGGLVGKELYRFLDKPRVVIEYRRPVFFHQEDGCFISIKIANAGRSVAENTLGVLSLYEIDNKTRINPNEAATFENLHEYQDEAFQFENPRPQIVTRDSQFDLSNEALCWAVLGNPGSININPGVSHRLDICKFFDDGERRYFIFPCDRGWRKVLIRLEVAEIQGRILICPENDFPTAMFFSITAKEIGQPIFKLKRPSTKQALKLNFRRSRAFLD